MEILFIVTFAIFSSIFICFCLRGIYKATKSIALSQYIIETIINFGPIKLSDPLNYSNKPELEEIEKCEKAIEYIKKYHSYNYQEMIEAIKTFEGFICTNKEILELKRKCKDEKIQRF